MLLLLVDWRVGSQTRRWFLCVSLPRRLWTDLWLYYCSVILLKIPELSSQSCSLSLCSLALPTALFKVSRIGASFLCDPGQWPLDLPRNGKCEWWVHQKRGFESYIVLCQQPLLLMLTLQPPSLSQLCSPSSVRSKKACRCLKCFLAGPCPMEMPVPVQRTTMAVRLLIRYLFFQNLKHALARTPLDITHPIPIHLDVQRPGWFLFLSVIFFLLPSTHPVPELQKYVGTTKSFRPLVIQ